MADLNPDKTKVGNLRNTEVLFEVGVQNTEGISDNKETEYLNPNFTQYFGYYKTIPELKAAVDAKSTWVIGKGYTADSHAQVILEHVSGAGVDTFNSILKNMVIISHINGDAYAEIIRDPKTKILINLKPLDPSSITVVFNRQGLITKYKQRSKTGKKRVQRTFLPNEIFHLTKDRVADEIHGTSIIEAGQWVIEARGGSTKGYRGTSLGPDWIENRT